MCGGWTTATWVHAQGEAKTHARMCAAFGSRMLLVVMVLSIAFKLDEVEDLSDCVRGPIRHILVRLVASCQLVQLPEVWEPGMWSI